ncbi:MAG: xanthine dehydrogenase family protein molybdopterin-binding subunit [Syntrophobacteraceae bacterium]|nr:xanthine dehydrogenase family protein molybdopterin-binding subunit [Syntrophobacteraceae bacterium]
MAQPYRYIGKATPRKDGLDIVTGESRFVDDLKFERLLHGVVVRSPHAHAMIKSIDSAGAKGLEGVRAVLTREDIPDFKYGNPRVFRLLDRKVRYVGDAVALIAAESEQIAREAAGLVAIDYHVLPAVFDDYEAMEPGAPQLYEEFPGNVLPLGDPFLGQKSMVEIRTGDVADGLSEADVIIAGKCGYDNLPNPMPMESPRVVASWGRGVEGRDCVTFWISNQAPYLMKVILGAILGANLDVRVFGGPCGGSFGSKLMSWQPMCYAALLSKNTGRPVKVVYSKEEHLGSFVLRPSSRLDIKVGMKKDGTVTAIAGDWLIGTGCYSQTTQAQVAVGCGEAMIALRCKNWSVKPKIVCTNRTASGIARGFGGQELKCALFPILSRGMEKLQIDPLDFMKKNFIKPGDGYLWRDAQWYDYRGISFTAMMDRGAEVFGWKQKWKGWLTPTSVEGAKRIGIGVGVHGNADVGEDVSEAYVRIDSNGSIVVHSCLQEHGTGQRSNGAKVVAEVLQTPLEWVSMTPADTMVNPFEFGPFGSRGTYVILGAIIRAAEDARSKLFEVAAPMLGCAASELDTADGYIWAKSAPKRRVRWQRALFQRTILGYGRFEPDYSLSNCLMSFVEVEVDTETGNLVLQRVVNATDVGQIIDPQGLAGQLCGCLGTAGIDSAIFEETILDSSTGRILNANMIDYKWRTSSEMPTIDNVVFQTPMPTHRFHAIGVGEIATAPGPSAVLMAASNAIGAWLDSYPVTPCKVLRALGKVGNAGNKQRAHTARKRGAGD